MLLRASARRLAASTGGFSSAAFTGDDGGVHERHAKERELLTRHHQSSSSSSSSAESPRGSADGAASSSKPVWEETCSPTGFGGTGRGDGEADSADGALARPTIDTYRAMTDDELAATLQTRDEQIRQLRVIYENFHYDADHHFRKMIFDYHDKTMQLSQVHGRMQQASLQINREALSKMRDEQDMMTRDKRIIFTLCTVWTLVFWVWVRRHYVRSRELEQEPLVARDWAQMSPSITGIGSYNDNFFGSNKRNARFTETAWERELRERREAQEARERELALLRNQTELQKAVAAQRDQQRQQQQQQQQEKQV
ncbi:hypothetical protein NESM_000061600 [Novymonas esmeraldas]|uniref:Uncharacterized protein n=1 Tax=Novymonas esmeraldas TaxID=1808958 RepID=A0AAW0F2K2_9TRYP